MKGKPSVLEIIRVIEQQKQSEQWKKEGGQFIPHPATWLNQGRWADEVLSMESPMKRAMNSFLERHKEEA